MEWSTSMSLEFIFDVIAIKMNWLLKKYSLQARQSHKRLRVVRLETTTDNRRIVGLLVPNAAVESVLQGLSISLPSLTHAESYPAFMHTCN